MFKNKNIVVTGANGMIGTKLTELLKQNQYSPMTVAQQVIAVFSGVRGFLDDVD